MNITVRRSVAALTLAAAALVPMAGANAATATTKKAATATTSAKKVNANTASAAQIEGTLTAAGVSNAARWTKEIQEYRPYTAGFAKLRAELGKYGIAPAQLDKIVATLTV